MQSITISLRHLRNLVEPVLPFAGTDNMVPVLRAVQVESHGKWLVATTTDRFRVAKKRIKSFDSEGRPVEWPAFEALIDASTFRSILTTFKGPRHLDPELTLSVDGERLEVEASGGLLFARASIAYDLVLGEYPKVGSLFRAAISKPGEAAEGSFNPAYMADFKNIGRALSIKRGGGDRDPFYITDGADFIALLMPRVMVSDSVAEPWDDLLEASPKSAKASAKPAAAPLEAVSA